MGSNQYRDLSFTPASSVIVEIGETSATLRIKTKYDTTSTTTGVISIKMIKNAAKSDLL